LYNHHYLTLPFQKTTYSELLLAPTKAVSGGWWVLMKPLPPGDHVVSFGGSVVDNPTTGTQSFATKATYNLNVK